MAITSQALRRALEAAAVLVLTAGGLGLLPFAPGTWGTLGGVLLLWLFRCLEASWLVLPAAALFFSPRGPSAGSPSAATGGRTRDRS